MPTLQQESITNQAPISISNQNSLLNKEPVKIAAGISLGMLGCYIPFGTTYHLARVANLNSASVSGFEGLIAGAGLAACVMGAIAIYDSRASLKAVGALSFVLFALLGLLVSLTV